MSVHEINARSIREIKRQARSLSRSIAEKSYMQYLDQVARERFGVRHYHEAQVRAGKAAPGRVRGNSRTVFYRLAGPGVQAASGTIALNAGEREALMERDFYVRLYTKGSPGGGPRVPLPAP